MQYVIPVNAVETVVARIEKLNKRFMKAGLPVIEYAMSDVFVDRNKEYVNATIETPALGGLGFKLIGMFDVERDGNNFVTMFDGSLPKPAYVESNGFCEHCNIDRYRKTIFIVQDQDGIVLQVGKTCMSVACGTTAEMLTAMVSFRDFITQFEDDFEGFPPSWSYTLRNFVAVADFLINRDGFISGKKAYEEQLESTSKYVARKMRETNILMELTQENWDNADFGIALASVIDPKNSFEQNLKTLSEKEYVSEKQFGFAAYLPVMVQKEKAIAAPKNGGFYGETTKRYKNVAVKLTNAFRGQSMMGAYTIFTFVTTDGDVLKWMTSTDVDMTKGVDYEITFTVKKHTTYKNVKETQITRVKLEK